VLKITRESILSSLDQQRRLLADSIVLTPVDSLPFCLADRQHTAFLHGLYLTDKVRDRAAMLDAVIQFPAREAAATDLAKIHQLLADAFGGAEGSLRLLAGLQAHIATFMSIAGAGQSVALLPEAGGGHFCTHAILERLGLKTIDLPIDYERLCVDQAGTYELIERERPDFIFIDRSEGLRYEDFAFVGALPGPVKVFDASQYVAPIVTGGYQSPLAWGFDLALFTLHKSFPGPQKAGIVSREDGELWRRLLSGLSTLVSSSHAENSYLVGLTLLRKDSLQLYVQRMIDTALELERQLISRELPVIRRTSQGDPGWPSTHHIWIRAEDHSEAFARYERLAAVNIHTNYRKLPYGLGYGLRLGTTFAATAGIDPSDASVLAYVVSEAMMGDDDSANLRTIVRDIAHDARSRAILPVDAWARASTDGRTDRT
jgi:glycine hydroxymethyltransferase